MLLTTYAYLCSRSSEYVFAVTKDKFYNDLDLHADTVEGDVKLPLVVYGDEGMFNRKHSPNHHFRTTY